MRYLIICLLLFSCSVAKKDQRALNRVEADINLLNHAGNKWVQLNPCYPDTVRVGNTVTVIDSSGKTEAVSRLNRRIDELLNRPNPNIDSIRQVIKKEVEKECKPVTIYKNRTDTIRDKRNEDLLRNELTTERLTSAKMEGQIMGYLNENSELKSDVKKQRWWTIGISALAVVIIAGLIVLLFKRK